jgi:hypothetical protein
MQLKHFFVFLLVFFLSVAESTVYAQESTSNYYQSSKIIKVNRVNSKRTKQITFKNVLVSNHYFLAFLFSSIHLKNTLQEQTQLTIKLQKHLYQKIALLNNQHTFLINKITTSNSISILYTA